MPSSLPPSPQTRSALDLTMSDFDISETNFDLPPATNINGDHGPKRDAMKDGEISSAFELSDHYGFQGNNRNKNGDGTPFKNGGTNGNDILSPEIPSAEVKRHFKNFSYANDDYVISDNSIEYGRGKARNLSVNHSRRSSNSSSGRADVKGASKRSPMARKVTEHGDGGRASMNDNNNWPSPPNANKKTSSEDEQKNENRYNFAVPTEYKNDASFFNFKKDKDANSYKKNNYSNATNNYGNYYNTNNNDLPDITGLSSIFSSETGTKKGNKDNKYKTIASVPVDPDDQALFTAFNSFQRKVDKLENDKSALLEKIKEQDAELRALRGKYNEELTRYDDMEKRARKYKTMASNLKEQQQQFWATAHDENNPNQTYYWKEQYNNLQNKSQELEQQRNNALGVINDRDSYIGSLESQVHELKEENSRLGGNNNTDKAGVKFAEPSEKHTVQDPTASSKDASTANTAPVDNNLPKESLYDIKQLLVKLLESTERQTDSSAQTPETRQKQDDDSDTIVEPLQKDYTDNQVDNSSVIEALQGVIERLRHDRVPSEKQAPVKQNTKKSQEKNRKSSASWKHAAVSDKSDALSSSEESDEEDFEKMHHGYTDYSASEPEIEVPTKKRNEKKQRTKRHSSAKPAASDLDSERKLRLESTAVDSKSKSGSKTPRLIDRVYEVISSNCDVCHPPKTTAANNIPYSSASFKGESLGWDEENTIRPSMDPEDSVKLVLEKMSNELSTLKKQYSGLMTDYNDHNPANRKSKRHEVAEGLKGLVDEMESKADQIYAMYDVIAATKINVEENNFENESDDGNEEPVSLLGKHQWIHT